MKYTKAYESWERRLNRLAVVIELKEQQLLAAADKDDEMTTNRKRPRSSSSSPHFGSPVNHVPNALPYWIVADDQDRERFIAEQQKRAEQTTQQENPNEKTKAQAQPNESCRKATAEIRGIDVGRQIGDRRRRHPGGSRNSAKNLARFPTRRRQSLSIRR